MTEAGIQALKKVFGECVKWAKTMNLASDTRLLKCGPAPASASLVAQTTYFASPATCTSAV